MLTSPTTTFLVVLLNLMVVLASLTMAIFILPRLRPRINFTIVAGISFMVFNALQHLDVTYEVLFGDEDAPLGVSWHMGLFATCTAISLVALVAGIFVDIREWEQFHKTRGPKSGSGT